MYTLKKRLFNYLDDSLSFSWFFKGVCQTIPACCSHWFSACFCKWFDLDTTMLVHVDTAHGCFGTTMGDSSQYLWDLLSEPNLYSLWPCTICHSDFTHSGLILNLFGLLPNKRPSYWSRPSNSQAEKIFVKVFCSL